MRICIVSHYFWPEISAPSARLSELARTWIEKGHDVTVVTNLPNHPTGIIHPGYTPNALKIEEFSGIRIIRCRTYATPNRGVIKKTIGHLVLAMNTCLEATRHLRDIDVVLASSPTLFSVLGAWRISALKRCPMVLEIRDLWPAIFVGLGVLKNRAIIRTLQALEMMLYHESRHIVSVTRSFTDDIARRGIPEHKLSTIPNGVDLNRFVPGSKPQKLAEEFRVKGKFVVLYVGAHGISHGLRSILETARLLQDDPELHILFIGEGAEKTGLIEHARTHNIINVSFLPGQPRERMADIYRLADICLVPLRNIPLFRSFIPSKMFEIMGAGRPIAASVEGEAADILIRSGAATITPPEDSAALADSLRRLKADPATRQEMGLKGREFVTRHYDRRALGQEYLSILERAVSLK